MIKLTRRGALFAIAMLALALPLAACGGSDDSLEGNKDTKAKDSEPLVIGSQDYYSNEIIAEIYAQALEHAGRKVERDFRIGVREVYIKDIEDGSIDLFPEYTGNLLQYYDPKTTAKKSDDVYTALQDALPEGLRVLDMSSATDQDSYNVTKKFSEAHDVTSLADLKDVNEQLTIGGNSELKTRPYGPKGLKSVYGVDVDFTPIEDNGGPLTLKALRDDDVQMVNIFSADPKISSSDLVTLDDPEGLFLASNVVPVVSKRVDKDAADVIDEVNAKLTPEGLVALNAKSVDEEQSAKVIAKQWLEDEGLLD
jgi:osmoprotectant transport system substrate-binding protein